MNLGIYTTNINFCGKSSRHNSDSFKNGSRKATKRGKNEKNINRHYRIDEKIKVLTQDVQSKQHAVFALRQQIAQLNTELRNIESESHCPYIDYSDELNVESKQIKEKLESACESVKKLLEEIDTQTKKINALKVKRDRYRSGVEHYGHSELKGRQKEQIDFLG